MKNRERRRRVLKIGNLLRLVLLLVIATVGMATSVPDARAEFCGGAYTCVGMIGYIYIPWTQRVKQSNCQPYARPFREPGIPDVNSIQQSAGNPQLWTPDEIDKQANEFVDASDYVVDASDFTARYGSCSAIASEPAGVDQPLTSSTTVKILGYRLFTASSPKNRTDLNSGPSHLLFALVVVLTD